MDIKITDVLPWFNPKGLSGVLFQKEGIFHIAGKGNARMSVHVEHDGPYDFSGINLDNNPLTLYITDKNGENMIELYEYTKPKETGNEKVIELTKGDYYFIVITDGKWSFSYRYHNS